MGENVIYTVGTSNRREGEFIGLLKKYQINLLVDIRRFPTSKFEHFRKKSMEKYLKEKGIEYLYLGKELGGYRKGGYQNYIRTAEFKEGLNQIEKLAERWRVCIFCSERFAFRCHRRFVGEALVKLGYRVIHIIEKDKIWIPKRNVLE